MAKKIVLTQGQVATVCDCHYESVANKRWHAEWSEDTHSFYAARNAFVLERLDGKPRIIRMHVEINRTPRGFQTDHIDGDTLNNQCSNLRTTSVAENLHNRGKQKNNTSGFKGVVWNKRASRWQAQIASHGRHIYIGLFDTPEEAAREYDRMARDLHGEHASTNFKGEI